MVSMLTLSVVDHGGRGQARSKTIMVSMLTLSVVDHGGRGQARPKTIKLVLAASLLSMQH